MGRIVTFYSYKGGVGRSMALANVAVLLARMGKKVLVVDWDLEAPGIEQYFRYFEMGEARGLLSLFLDFRDAPEGRRPDWRSYGTQVSAEAPQPITLLPSGRESNPNYARDLEAFDWEALFRDHGGGDFVESLRDDWRRDFDLVLIDSRTGLSDTGGICTIQLPDIVVAMFTANQQSVYGVRDVMQLAQQARQRLAYDRMPLTVLPLPARWGVQEFKETQVWVDRIAEAMQEFYSEWLPQPLPVREVVERIKVPQRDYFSFGERLAVVEHGTTDPTGMGFVYERVARFLASDMTELERLVGNDMAAKVQTMPAAAAGASGPYAYDVFVSYEKAMAETVLQVVEHLRAPLAQELGREARFFVDVREVAAGESFVEHIARALEGSAVLLPFITPRYVSGEFTTGEYRHFVERERSKRLNLIVPVVLRDLALPSDVDRRVYIDLRSASRTNSRSTTPVWMREVYALAMALAGQIKAATAREKTAAHKA